MIEIETREAIALVRMVRGKGNALNIDLLEAFDRCLDTLESPEIRAAVITGKGSVFGAGVDLSELIAGGQDYVRRFIPLLNRVFERLARFPKPLVAAVNGHAIAGGAVLMLACDQKIAASGPARFGLTEIQVGVPFPAWALEIARFATPAEHFQTLILTGRTWGVAESLARGLVDEVVEPEHLQARAMEVAAELGALLPATYAATKLAVRRPLFEAVAASAPSEAAVAETWSSPEVLQQIGQFVERMIKRKS